MAEKPLHSSQPRDTPAHSHLAVTLGFAQLKDDYFPPAPSTLATKPGASSDVWDVLPVGRIGLLLPHRVFPLCPRGHSQGQIFFQVTLRFHFVPCRGIQSPQAFQKSLVFFRDIQYSLTSSHSLETFILRQCPILFCVQWGFFFPSHKTTWIFKKPHWHIQSTHC